MLERFMDYLKYFPEFNHAIVAAMLILARFLGLSLYAPIFGRKDLPMMIKISFALILTVIFTQIMAFGPPPKGSAYFLALFLNLVFGGLLGFIAQTIFAVVESAGDIINMQMALSSAMVTDPSTKEQTSLIGRFFAFLATIIFLKVGGIYWLLSAFQRSFDIFPIYANSIPLDKILSMNYLILLSSNVLVIGLQISAPVLLATLCMDVLLGIISKTAPQVNVFQLSFLFKPIMGLFVLLFIFKIMVSVISDHFLSYSQLF